MNTKKIYVCYEANYGECAVECGPVTAMCAFANPEQAIEWLVDRTHDAKAEGFSPEDDEYATGDRDDDGEWNDWQPDTDAIRARLNEGDDITLNVVYSYDECYDYAICIKPMDIE